MKKSGLDVSFLEIEASAGHDAFLLPSEELTSLLRGFLRRVHGAEVALRAGEGKHAL
jgi:homoserine O-acetyltransferase